MLPTPYLCARVFFMSILRSMVLAIFGVKVKCDMLYVIWLPLGLSLRFCKSLIAPHVSNEAEYTFSVGKRKASVFTVKTKRVFSW